MKMHDLRFGAAVMVCLFALFTARLEAIDVYSTSFEASEGYTLGVLNGQQGWEADATPGDCQVQTDSSQGDQAVRIRADGSYAGSHIYHLGARKKGLTDLTLTNPVVTVSFDMKITALNEAKYAVWISPKSGGAIVTGLTFEPDGDIVASGPLGEWLPSTAYCRVSMELDYNTRKMDVFYDNLQVGDDDPFTSSGQGFGGLSFITDDKIEVASSSMYLDHLAITAVPEPATLLVLGLGGLALLRKRRA